MSEETINPVARVVEYTDRGKQVWTWCPGCDALHPFTIESINNQLNNGITWDWDGNLEAPTFSPSLLCHTSVHLCEGQHELTECTDPDCESLSHAILYRVDGTLHQFKVHHIPDGAEEVRGHVGPHPAPYDNTSAFGQCHSFLKNGRWEFLTDSAHHLAGQTVDMIPLPDYLAGKDD